MGLPLSSLIGHMFALVVVACIMVFSFMEYRSLGMYGSGAKLSVIVTVVLGLEIEISEITLVYWCECRARC